MSERDFLHTQRLRELHLIPPTANGANASDASNALSEAADLARASETLEAEYNLLVPLVLAFGDRVDECREAAQFLRLAVRAAERDESAKCKTQIDDLERATRDAKIKAANCEAGLRSALNALPPRRRLRVERFLRSITTTATARSALETSIVDVQ